MILAQAAELEKAVQIAIEKAGNRGYEAVMLIVVVIALGITVGICAKIFLNQAGKQNERLHAAYQSQLLEAAKREERMAMRIDKLEDMLTTKLLEVYTKVTQALTELNSTLAKQNALLEGRVCLMNHEQQVLALRRSTTGE